MSDTALPYSFQTRLDLPYEQAIAKVTAALKAQGFGVLTEIDVKATMKQKLGVDFRKYIILGACNPPLAHQALRAELNIGLFMPCNAIIYEDDAGGCVVAILDPAALLEMSGASGLDALAEDGHERIRRVMEALHR